MLLYVQLNNPLSDLYSLDYSRILEIAKELELKKEKIN